MNLAEMYVLRESLSQRYDISFVSRKYGLTVRQEGMLHLVVEAMDQGRRVPIDHYYPRRAGKTYALISFAKEYRIPVLVYTDALAQDFRRYYNYNLIFSQRSREERFRGYDFVLADDYTQNIRMDNVKIYGYT
jgi:hypothetical protein